ncbi:BON domain-containing protein [Streptomyces sp. NBC_01618]|uniref:BON domain-containing protein n=1 Tax=Streptomyces sp. NBC_01618 TaxID=2975900 RepID=UPI00386A4C03
MLEGVVSRSDLLKVFLRPDEEIDEEIRSSVVAELPPAERPEFSVLDGVVTLKGPLRNRSLVPLLARAIRAVEGVVDVRISWFPPRATEGSALAPTPRAPGGEGRSGPPGGPMVPVRGNLPRPGARPWSDRPRPRPVRPSSPRWGPADRGC